MHAVPFYLRRAVRHRPLISLFVQKQDEWVNLVIDSACRIEPPHVVTIQTRNLWDPFKLSRLRDDETFDDSYEEAVNDDLDEKSMSTFERTKLFIAKYGWLIAGSAVSAYLLSKSFMFMSGYLININFKTVGYITFSIGFVSGTSTAAAVYLMSRGFYIRPERVHREAFYQLRSNQELRQKMGISILNPMRAGIMRAYSITAGRFALDRVSRRIVWRRPAVKMIFQIYGGEASQAVVTCEAAKAFNGELDLNMIAADIIKHKGEALTDTSPLLIKGNNEDSDNDGVPDVITRSNLRNLVQLKKSYI